MFKLKEGTVGQIISKIKGLQIQIIKVELKADFNTDGDTDIRYIFFRYII